jgi:hypothetical protein
MRRYSQHGTLRARNHYRRHRPHGALGTINPWCAHHDQVGRQRSREAENLRARVSLAGGSSDAIVTGSSFGQAIAQLRHEGMVVE